MPPVNFKTSGAEQHAGKENPLQETFIKLDEAERLRQQGKLDRAQVICEGLVRRHPDYMGALHTLGLIHADRKNYERALDCLVRAVMLNPLSWTSITALSGVYLRLNAREMAIQTLRQAQSIQADDPSVLITLGEIYREDREYELAQSAYRQALRLDPTLAPALFGLGTCCATLGEYSEAAEAFETLVKGNVRFLELLLALTGLPASYASVDILAELKRLPRDDNHDQTERDDFNAFIRAAVFDKIGRHEEAWQDLLLANELMFRKSQTELRHAQNGQQLSLAYLKQLPRSLTDAKLDVNQTISLFILGPSRSGKTTMEKLVATLDGVKRGYENPIVENSIKRTFQSSALLTSTYFSNLPVQLNAKCADIYTEELIRRAGGAKVFTNTHPARIHDAARIFTTFPNVRCILIKRDIDDVTIRTYMRKYAGGNAHAYDLKSIREHITWYYEMMDLLFDRFPNMVRIIKYEDMVADPQSALRQACDLCGLPYAERELPPTGDDRGCSAPYREYLAAN